MCQGLDDLTRVLMFNACMQVCLCLCVSVSVIFKFLGMFNVQQKAALL